MKNVELIKNKGLKSTQYVILRKEYVIHKKDRDMD